MRLYVNPTQDVLDALSDEDAFMFSSGEQGGPKVPGLVVYYPRVNGSRHSRFFKAFKAMEAELMPSEVVR